MTSVVTLPELDILCKHLGMSLEVEPRKNGRLWAFKHDGRTVISNKDFEDVSSSINFTVCQVQRDVITFHSQLQILLTYAQTIHQDFIDVHKAYPALNILSQTCFLGKSFQDLMKLSLNEHKTCIKKENVQIKAKRSIIGALFGDNDLINALSSNMQKALKIQDSNFNKIYELDKSLVKNLNSLLENEKSHDKDIRLVYQLLKSLGYHFDLINNRAISFNIRTNQGHVIMHELKSLNIELKKLKDALHHTTTCTFSQCVVSRHLHKMDNDQLVLTEQIQKYRLDKNYLILCIPASQHKVSSLHNQIAHKINDKYLVLESGERIPVENLSNHTMANEHLQFITRDMLIFEDYPRYKNLKFKF